MKPKPKPRMKMKMTKKQTNMWQSRLHSRVTRTVENLTPTFLQQFLSPTFFFLLTFSNLFSYRLVFTIGLRKDLTVTFSVKKIHNFSFDERKFTTFSLHENRIFLHFHLMCGKNHFYSAIKWSKVIWVTCFFLAINNSKWQN